MVQEKKIWHRGNAETSQRERAGYRAIQRTGKPFNLLFEFAGLILLALKLRLYPLDVALIVLDHELPFAPLLYKVPPFTLPDRTKYKPSLDS